MEKIRKKLIILFIVFIVLIMNSTISNASSSATYLYMESIKIVNSNIEILSDETLIDTTTSKIEKTINIRNTSNEKQEIDLVIPLELKDIDITVKDVSIKLNDVKVEYEKDKDGNYIVKSRISGNSGKKIEIEFFTENDLQKARTIKLNFDNFKDKKVGKVKVDVKIDDRNIPFVEAIYPGHFTFEDNTISIEYYNYEVNTLTRDVIIKKETFSNLLYGREFDIQEKEKDIINSWYKDGKIKIDEEYDETFYDLENEIVRNIYNYALIKQGKELDWEPSDPLLYGMYKGSNDKQNMYFNRELEGRTICVDYVETEGDKELYVSKVIDEEKDEDGYIEYIEGLERKDEMTILQTEGAWSSYRGQMGAKIIFIGQGINGENLKATDEEKVSYINQINADMYIRIEIYDGKINYKKIENEGNFRIGNGMVGYYDTNNLEIAKAFSLGEWDNLKDEEWYNRGDNEYKIYYSNYEEYAKNYYNDYFKDCLIELKNKDITNKCEIPTVVQFIGNRVERNGKYVVDYFDDLYAFYDRGERGLSTANQALQTSQAKKMLSANRQKNSNVKAEVEKELSNLSITDDEYKVQKEIKDEIEERKRQEILKIKQEEEARQAKIEEKEREQINKHILIFSCFGLGILVCIIVIIKQNLKGKKEN